MNWLLCFWRPRSPMTPPSPGWNTRNSQGVIHSKSKVPRTKSVDVSVSAESEFAIPLTFCSLRALSGLDDATSPGEGSLLYLVSQFRC